MPTPYEPTLEEIKKRREAIRAKWSETTLIKRSGYRKEVPKIKVCSTDLLASEPEVDNWLYLSDYEAKKNKPPLPYPYEEEEIFLSENEDEGLDFEAEVVHTFGTHLF